MPDATAAGMRRVQLGCVKLFGFGRGNRSCETPLTSVTLKGISGYLCTILPMDTFAASNAISEPGRVWPQDQASLTLLAEMVSNPANASIMCRVRRGSKRG